MDTPYTPLLYHSNYGVGGSDFKTLFDHLHRNNLKSCGLVDITFFGLHEFIKYAKQYEIKPIIGARINLTKEKSSKSYLIIQNEEGYSNLSKIVTEMSFDRINIPYIEEHARGIILLTNSLGLLRKLGPSFSLKYYLLLPCHAIIDNAFPAVATNEIFYVTEKDKIIYRLMCTIKGNPYENKGILPYYLLSNEKFNRVFTEYPTAIRNNIELSEMCNYTPENRGWIFPVSNGHLHDIIEQKCKNLTGKEKKRLDHEYEIIMNTGFAPHFSLVYHLKEFALEKSIGMNVRGSAASSFILYKLGLSITDPLKHNLPFERFLNPQRTEPPDIDVDVEFNERERLIREIYKKFGGDHVAHISVINRFKRRASFRETARAYGISPRELKTINNHIEERTIRAIHDLSEKIIGYPHYFSCHPSGIVITPSSIRNYVPLYPSPADQITHLDKDGVEVVGLVKIDILGVRGFPQLYLSKEKINFDDPEVYNFIGRARTLGCFQIESPMVRYMLKRINPKTIMDIANAIAIIRPGPAQGGMKERFLKRIKGEEKIDYPHPKLQKALYDTLGIPVYQEQILQIAHDFAHFSLSDGDMLRRAMTKARNAGSMRELKEIFFSKAKTMGYHLRETEPVWDRIRSFSSFGFNKAHSITYATLAYLSAYQKYHEPAKFFCQVINNKGGYYPTIAYINEARRWGLEILAPDVDKSYSNFTIYGSSLLTGLDEIKELSKETIRKIIKMRPYQNVRDFFYRVRPSIDEGISLIKSRSLDVFGNTWPEFYFLLMDSKISKEAIPNFLEKVPELRDFNNSIKVLDQLKTIGFIPERHILEIFYPERQLRLSEPLNKTKLMGTLITKRTIRTRNGKLMCFLTIDDETGILEVVIFPNRYNPSKIGPIMGVSGTLQDGSLIADFYTNMPVAHNMTTEEFGYRWRSGEIKY
ncbi:MAG: DNA polymerase III subunit alpha [candidate division WOR-3 bacterium]|nr:MAG: DNA polymerase III subunit alpha [candidate division WOR-3 bacterium]